MPGPEFVVIQGRRVVAQPGALDAASWPTGALTLRLAADDVLLIGDGDIVVDDPFAIVCDEAGFSGAWLASSEFSALAQAHIHWALPVDRPALAQGLMAGVPVRVWLDSERVLLLTSTVSAYELAGRLA